MEVKSSYAYGCKKTTKAVSMGITIPYMSCVDRYIKNDISSLLFSFFTGENHQQTFDFFKIL